jgi:hypothetical protein
LKVVALASAGIIGSTWALVRHYTHPPPPMVVTVPLTSAPAPRDADAGAVYEITTESVP